MDLCYSVSYSCIVDGQILMFDHPLALMHMKLQNCFDIESGFVHFVSVNGAGLAMAIYHGQQETSQRRASQLTGCRGRSQRGTGPQGIPAAH